MLRSTIMPNASGQKGRHFTRTEARRATRERVRHRNPLQSADDSKRPVVHVRWGTGRCGVPERWELD
jgi:hypothetical protein